MPEAQNFLLQNFLLQLAMFDSDIRWFNMQSILKLFSLVALFVVTSQALAQDKPEPTPVDGKIEWVFDYDEGKKLSKQHGKPIFVVFRCER